MRKSFLLLVSATLALTVQAWADPQADVDKMTSVKKATKCLFPKSRELAPDWVCNAHADGLALAAVGSSAKSGAGISFMEQMAASDARVHLARKLRGSVQSKIMSSEGAAKRAPVGRDSPLLTRITNESLRGTRIVSSAYGPDVTLYVIVGLDEENAKKLIDSISADYLAQKRR